jgi:hypothetical protein
MLLVGRHMAVSARAKLVRLATQSYRHAAFEYVKKTLPMGWPQRSAGFELCRVLREGSSDRRCRMHNNSYRIKTGQRHAYESIRRL